VLSSHVFKGPGGGGITNYAFQLVYSVIGNRYICKNKNKTKHGLQYRVALYTGYSVLPRVKRNFRSIFEVSCEEVDEVSFSAIEIEPVIEGFAVPCETVLIAC
jgi:hypothetical protein